MVRMLVSWLFIMKMLYNEIGRDGRSPSNSLVSPTNNCNDVNCDKHEGNTCENKLVVKDTCSKDVAWHNDDGIAPEK